MTSKEAREAAIKKASQQVRAGGVFSRASAASKVSPNQVASGYATCADCGNPLNDSEHFRHDVCDCCRESL